MKRNLTKWKPFRLRKRRKVVLRGVYDQKYITKGNTVVQICKFQPNTDKRKQTHKYIHVMDSEGRVFETYLEQLVPIVKGVNDK